jgi:oxygen-dependent protoporphyrinogen oxidase
MADPRPDAIVVGGGIAGMVVARDLAMGGMRVLLLEAADRLGGKVASHRVAGVVLDSGAESFATRRGTVVELAAELGLGPAIVQPNPAGAWLMPATGEPLPLPATGLLGIPARPLASDVIQAIGLPAALRAQLDTVLAGSIGSGERTLAGLVRRRMGRAVLDELVRPVVAGIHSRQPEELEVDVVAPGLRSQLHATGSLSAAVSSIRAAAPAGSAVSGISGGIHRIVERLATELERLGVECRLQTTVVGASATGVALADGGRLEAGTVVLATPLQPAAAPPTTLVTLVIDAPGLDAAPRGTGMLVAGGRPGIRAKALTHSSAKWPWLADALPRHRHVLRLSYAEGATAEGTTVDATVALADASLLLGLSLDPAAVVGSDRIEWAGVRQATATADGVVVVGEAVAGTGLAGVILQARDQSGRLLRALE